MSNEIEEKHQPGVHDQRTHAGSRHVVVDQVQTPNEKAFSIAQAAAKTVDAKLLLSKPGSLSKTTGTVPSAIVMDVATSLDENAASTFEPIADSLEDLPDTAENDVYLRAVQYASGIVNALELHTDMLKGKQGLSDSFRTLVTDDLRKLSKLIPDSNLIQTSPDVHDDILHTTLNRMGVVDYSDPNDRIAGKWNIVSAVKKNSTAIAAEEEEGAGMAILQKVAQAKMDASKAAANAIRERLKAAKEAAKQK